eukprot:1751070-Rhodomonas_salina.1
MCTGVDGVIVPDGGRALGHQGQAWQDWLPDRCVHCRVCAPKLNSRACACATLWPRVVVNSIQRGVLQLFELGARKVRQQNLHSCSSECPRCIAVLFLLHVTAYHRSAQSCAPPAKCEVLASKFRGLTCKMLRLGFSSRVQQTQDFPRYLGAPFPLPRSHLLRNV